MCPALVVIIFHNPVSIDSAGPYFTLDLLATVASNAPTIVLGLNIFTVVIKHVVGILVLARSTL